MIAPYYVPYGFKELSCALLGLTQPFPDLGRGWMPAFKVHGIDAFATNQGREAQYALLRALRLPTNARVGVPVFTHPVVWQTIAAAGMRPVFIDTDPVTLGLNIEDLRKKRDAIDSLILVHTFGYPADFEQVAMVMEGKPILEDCAHALGSTYRGRPLGSLGNGSFFTFLFSKSLRAGGGGCALTRDPEVGQRVENLLREGPDETLLEGLLHIMGNVVLSVSYKKPFYSLLTLLTSSRQYRRVANSVRYRVSSNLAMRRSDWQVVASRLKDWDAVYENHSEFWLEIRAHLPKGWRIPAEPQFGEWNHWLMPICAPNEKAATAGIAKLRSRGIGARLIYLYSPEAARSYLYRGDCPEAERLSRLVFVLPSHSGLSSAERSHIVRSIELLPAIN